MNKEKSDGNILYVSLYIISGVLGILSMIKADIEVKHFLEFVGRGLIFWLIVEIIVFIGTLILNKKYKKGISVDESQKILIPYFLLNIITLIILALNMEGNTKILGIIVGALLFDFLPILFTHSLSCWDYEFTDNSVKNTSTSAKKDTSIATQDIYDKFGNRIGSSTEYNDGITGIKKTYVKDNLGNTVAESTTIDNHTTTKINTTGRY